MINKFAKYEEMLNQRDSEDNNALPNNTNIKQNENQTSESDEDNEKDPLKNSVSTSGIHSEYSRVHIPPISVRNDSADSIFEKSASNVNQNQTDIEMTDTLSNIDILPSSELSLKENETEHTQTLNDSVEPGTAPDILLVNEPADKSVLQEDSIQKPNNSVTTTEQQTIESEEKKTEQVIEPDADETISNSAMSDVPEVEQNQNPESESVQDMKDSTNQSETRNNLEDNQDAVPEKQGITNVLTENGIFTATDTEKDKSDNGILNPIKQAEQIEKEEIVSRHARFFSAEVKVAEYVQKEAENLKNNSENVTHTRFISEQFDSHKNDNAKQSSLFQMFQSMEKNDMLTEPEKKTDVPNHVFSAKDYRNKENLSAKDDKNEALQREPEVPIEERNPLFRNARQGLDELPQPSVGSHLILENISEERQKKAPLLYSEKKAMSYYGNQKKDNGVQGNQNQIFLRARASQFSKQETQQNIQKEMDFQNLQIQEDLKNFGPSALQNGNTKKQKLTPQKTEQEQPKIQLLDSILTNPNASLGELLSAARKDAGLSLEDISSATRISQNYLLALENDNGAKLPSYVFLNSYIRSVCQCYHLKDEVVQIFLDKLKSTENYVLSDTDKIIARLSVRNVPLNNSEQDEDEQQKFSENEDRKIRSYIFIGIGTFAVIAVIIIAIVLTSVFSNSRPGKEDEADNIGIATVKQISPDNSTAGSIGDDVKMTDTISSKDLEVLNAPCILGTSSVKMQSRIEVK